MGVDRWYEAQEEKVSEIYRKHFKVDDLEAQIDKLKIELESLRNVEKNLRRTISNLEYLYDKERGIEPPDYKKARGAIPLNEEMDNKPSIMIRRCRGDFNDE